MCLALGGWPDPFGLVFTTEIGTSIDGPNLTRLFQRRLMRLELPRQRFRDLRHACASLLLAEGVPPKTIQVVLGHSQISLTADTYTHMAPTLPRDAAAALDRTLSGAQEAFSDRFVVTFVVNQRGRIDEPARLPGGIA